MKGLTIIILLFMASMAAAQSKGTELLDEVSARTKACKSIRAEFTYTMENKTAKIHEEKTGTLLVSGDKYRLDAAGQMVISDGKTIWTYIRESNEVQINTMDNKDDALTPSKLLSSYSTNYKARPVRDNSQAGTDAESFELTPVASKTFTKAILTVDRVKKQVIRFSIFDKNGNTFTYKVTKYQTDVPVTAADFVFDAKKFAGVEVIDMR